MKRTGRHISKKVIMLLPFCLFTLLPLSTSAQTFTQRIQKQGTNEGTLTVTHDKSIDDLVNNAVLTPAAAKPKTTTATPQQDKTAADNGQKKDDAKTEHKTITRQDTITVDSSAVDGRKKIMRNGYKVNGFRVQAFAGGNSRADRQKAEQVGNNIKMHYPEVPVYTHFYSPRWICRIGNFRTYEEAHQMLLNVRKLGYTSATIVKGKITVQY